MIVSIQSEESNYFYSSIIYIMVIKYVISIHGAREFVDEKGNELEENFIAFYVPVTNR